jgi:uncharacterized hydrophobic protein (TIGR00341 family)
MVEMTVSDPAPADLAELSEDLRIVGVWREPIDENMVLLRVLVRSDKTEAVIKELESRFQTSPSFRLVIFEVEATVPKPEEEEKPGETETGETGEEKEAKDPQRIACAELVERLSASATINRVFLMTVILSTVVAAIGLIRDNLAVIIGAMVIAPLLGPNMTLSLGTTLGDLKLVRNALRVNAVGLFIPLLLAVGIGFLAPVDPSVREIISRTEVSLSDLVLALAAGSAGALAFTTGLSSALVGVMVAVALLPPLVTTGLLVGAGDWKLALGSLLLTATNIICINLAGVATFLWQGVQPQHWWETRRAKRVVRIAGAVWVVLLGLLALLIVLAYD